MARMGVHQRTSSSLDFESPSEGRGGRSPWWDIKLCRDSRNHRDHRGCDFWGHVRSLYIYVRHPKWEWLLRLDCLLRVSLTSMPSLLMRLNEFRQENGCGYRTGCSFPPFYLSKQGILVREKHYKLNTFNVACLCERLQNPGKWEQSSK